jgi:phosphoglycolate phosphatase
MGFSHLFFDLDGTLFDTRPGIESSVRAAFKAVNLKPVVEDITPLIGPPLKPLMEALTGGSADSEAIAGLTREFAKHYDTEGHKRSLPFEGVLDGLKIFTKNGVKCYVVTNKRRIPTLRILDNTKTAGFFADVVTLDTPEKPFASKTEAAADLIRRYRVPAEEVVFVGDSSDDARAAYLNGIRFAGVSYGYGDLTTETEWPVSWHLDVFSELYEIIFKDRPELV